MYVEITLCIWVVTPPHTSTQGCSYIFINIYRYIFMLSLTWYSSLSIRCYVWMPSIGGSPREAPADWRSANDSHTRRCRRHHARGASHRHTGAFELLKKPFQLLEVKTYIEKWCIHDIDIHIEMSEASRERSKSSAHRCVWIFEYSNLWCIFQPLCDSNTTRYSGVESSFFNAHSLNVWNHNRWGGGRRFKLLKPPPRRSPGWAAPSPWLSAISGRGYVATFNPHNLSDKQAFSQHSI